MDFFGIGWGELLFIIVIALIFLGPGRIAEIGKALGKTVRAIRKAGTDFTSNVTKELSAEGKPLSPKQFTKDDSPVIQKTPIDLAPPEAENSSDQSSRP